MKKRSLSIYSIVSKTRRNGGTDRMSSLTKRVIAVAFTSEFMLIYPFYAIMFGNRSGVSAAGLGILLAAWQIVTVAAEIPTGVIADKISKKWSLVIARVLQTLTFVVWLFMPTFTGYLIGFIIWGIGEAFHSGAYQAYLYESLPKENKQSFGKMLARSSSMLMVAYAATNLIAFGIGPRYNFLLVMSVVVSLVALGLCLSLPAKKDELAVELKPKIMRTALATIRTNLALRRILVGAILLAGLGGMLFELLIVYYNQVGTPLHLVPLATTITSTVMIVTYWFLHHFARHVSKYLLPIMLVSTVLFALTFVGGTFVAVLGMLFYTRVMRIVSVVNETAIQHQAVDEARATIGSLYSFAGKLLSAGMLALVGLFAVNNQIVVSLRWSVVILIAVYAIVSLYFLWRQKSQPA